MDAQPCSSCDRAVEPTWRYCPWCAAPQRRKLVEFFAPHPAQAGDAELALRVSRYVDPDPDVRQTRVSIWQADGSAVAAIGLDDAETARLATYLSLPVDAAAPRDTLRSRLARRLFTRI